MNKRLWLFDKKFWLVFLISFVLSFLVSAWLRSAGAASTASYQTKFRKAEFLSLSCKAYDKHGVEIYRSKVRRDLFIRKTGGPRPGMFVNHIVPLACGGCDVPSNMEWMDKTDWTARTVLERTDCGRHPGGSW